MGQCCSGETTPRAAAAPPRRSGGGGGGGGGNPAGRDLNNGSSSGGGGGGVRAGGSPPPEETSPRAWYCNADEKVQVNVHQPEGVEMIGVDWVGCNEGQVIIAASVTENMAGYEAGMQKGWQVLTMGGKKVNSEATLKNGLVLLKNQRSCMLQMTPTYPASEVAKHKSKKSFWVVLGHRVLDVTDVLAAHPEKEAVFRGGDEERVAAELCKAQFIEPRPVRIGRVRPASIEKQMKKRAAEAREHGDE